MAAFKLLATIFLFTLVSIVTAYPPPPATHTTLARIVRRTASAPSITPRALPSYSTWSVEGAPSTSRVLDQATQVDVDCQDTGAYLSCMEGASAVWRCCIEQQGAGSYDCSTIAFTSAGNCQAAASQIVKCASTAEREECCSAAFQSLFGAGNSQGECTSYGGAGGGQ